MSWSGFTGLNPIAPSTTSPAPVIESDASLRDRLLYVAGDSAEFIKRIMTASGPELDLFAEEIGIKRRRS